MEKYADVLVRHVADRHGISVKEAVDLIETCLHDIAFRGDYQYDLVHAIAMHPDTLAACLKMTSACDQRTLEECEASCTCVVYQGQCRPRYLPDADLMNRDPDKYALSLTKEQLRELVDFCSYLYYNYDGGGITDNTFDALEYQLNKYEKGRQRQRDKVGAPPVDKIKAALPYPMGSLPKVKPATRGLREFMLRGTQQHLPLVWSEKLDGNSAMVVYQNGRPVDMYTRGDGQMGGRVSYMLEYVTLPIITDPNYLDIVVRGELVIDRQVFEDKYHSSYSFPRSFVTSKVNSGFVSPGLSDIAFLAYAIVDNGSSQVLPLTVYQCWTVLEQLAFQVPVHGLLTSPTEAMLMILYKETRQKSRYAIDGLVLEFNTTRSSWIDDATTSTSESTSGGEARVAFKMMLEDQLRETEIIDVSWQISRLGTLVPVAIYNAVYVDGARLHRATAFNAAHVRDWSLGRGTHITVVRSGDIIPQIQSVVVDDSIEPIYPPETPAWHWKDKILELDDVDGNVTVQLKRTLYFLETLRIPGIGLKTLEKFYEHGLRTIQQLTQASIATFKAIKGIGPAKSKKFYDGIHQALRTCRMDRLVVASPILKTGLGRTMIKKLLKEFPGILTLNEAEIRHLFKGRKVAGFGPKRIDTVATQIPAFMAFAYTLNQDDIQEALRRDMARIEQLKNPDPRIHGQSFVFTGFMHDSSTYELEDYITDNNGVTSDHVTEATAAVIVGSLGKITDKMERAYQYKIPIYTIQEFETEYGYQHLAFDETAEV